MPIKIMPGEVTPTLFVGLGGSGGQAIGRIAKRLRRAEDYEIRYRSLVRFVAIDTNAADLARLRKGHGAVGHVDSTITLSDFDKVEYTKLRRGETYTDADEYFTQWVHPWYRFREESGAGAGQIRIESRLGFFRSIEVGELTRQLQDVIGDLRSHRHGMRRQGASVQVFVYFSTAGGTGSGAFLPFGYLLRDIIGDKSARLFGFAILPDAFEEVVGMNRDGTLANGYAALKELEHVSRLDAQTAGVEAELPFHYDPRNKHKTTVSRRPYDLMYLVDRPADFSVDSVGEALADSTYVQIFSPILGDQQADYDNYTKESRSLFPSELGAEGYTAFYGTLGASVLLLPRRDLLDYCGRRFAATAVRRYLLLDDPALVSEEQREKFKQFNVDREELERLSPDARAARLDQAFLRKIDMLAEQDREGGTWHRLLTVRDTSQTRMQSTIQSIEEDLRSRVASVRAISADRILDDAWTPATTMNTLAREIASAKAEIEARTAGLGASIESGDFWADFLSKAGPDAAPELSPYEQRYVLVRFREAGGLLSAEQLDSMAQNIARLRKEADIGRDSRFRSEMDAHAAEIKRTYGGWDKLVTRKDKDFEAARDRTVATFNEYVDKARALLIQSALYEIGVALGRTADSLRGNFRNIESSAGRLAVELEEKARRFEYDGGLDAEANDYALDVEVLQHPNGRQRFWSYYYADQVKTRPETSDQSEILDAVRDALRPKFDEQGRPLRRTAREIVSDIESSLVDAAKRFLSKQILGDPKSDDEFVRQGLRLDDALALEAKYYALHTEHPQGEADDVVRDVAPLVASALWKQDAIQRYARRKLETALAKARPLTRFHAEAKSMINHADMLLLGVHPQLMSGGFKAVLDEATYGKSADAIEDWPDPDRFILYHSILGVPLYCFPHINEEMKSAYRRFQAKTEKGWPLHIDHNWEALRDLDPDDAKNELERSRELLRVNVAAMALGAARGTVVTESGTFALKLESGATLPLGGDVIGAANGLLEMEEKKPAVYDLMVADLVTDARKIGDSKALKEEAKTAANGWAKRSVELELLDARDKAEEAEYVALREATRLLKSLLA
ncbi:MAG: tubulin-like doman-containing protein [Myxococcota bacterium]